MEKKRLTFLGFCGSINKTCEGVAKALLRLVSQQFGGDAWLAFICKTHV